MPEIIEIPLSDFLADTGNARLVNEQTSQQATILALAKQESKKLLKLAADIVEHGLDPMTLPAVVAIADKKKQYTVIEGNRRVVALKALETPSLVASAFSPTDQKRLHQLSQKFMQKPIHSIKCVLFGPEEELNHWVDLRHTGQNEGVGLVEWGSNEKDRYAARHGQRSPAGKILDFVERAGLLSEEAQQSNTKVITNLARLIGSPAVKKKIGIEVVGRDVIMLYPAEEVTKSLTRVVEDLKTEKIKVGDIYTKEDRTAYSESLPVNTLPTPSTRLSVGKPLGAEGGIKQVVGKPTLKAKPKKSEAERGELIPKSCQLGITSPRISAIYKELKTLSLEQYSNACSVVLRVFVELSVDHYIAENTLMTDKDRRSMPLAKRLKVVADDLELKGRITPPLQDAIQKVANSHFVLAASTVTFNLYVHNEYTFPKPTELKVAWDELQPFMETLWFQEVDTSRRSSLSASSEQR